MEQYQITIQNLALKWKYWHFTSLENFSGWLLILGRAKSESGGDHAPCPNVELPHRKHSVANTHLYWVK